MIKGDASDVILRASKKEAKKEDTEQTPMKEIWQVCF